MHTFHGCRRQCTGLVSEINILYTICRCVARLLVVCYERYKWLQTKLLILVTANIAKMRAERAERKALEEARLAEEKSREEEDRRRKEEEQTAAGEEKEEDEDETKSGEEKSNSEEAMVSFLCVKS